MFEIELDKEADCVTVYLSESSQHVSMEQFKVDARRILQEIYLFEKEKEQKEYGYIIEEPVDEGYYLTRQGCDEQFSPNIQDAEIFKVMSRAMLRNQKFKGTVLKVILGTNNETGNLIAMEIAE